MRRRLRHWLRLPVCLVRGHRTVLDRCAYYVSEHAAKPPSTYCEFCGKGGV